MQLDLDPSRTESATLFLSDPIARTLVCQWCANSADLVKFRMNCPDDGSR
jgi:hypothetical protein